MSEVRVPDLSFVIPGWSENRWSDLLAALIKTDPTAMAGLIGAADDVRREVAVPGESSRKSDRLDLLLTHGNRQIAAIEVKVLSDLGLDQLAPTSRLSPRPSTASSCTWPRCRSTRRPLRAGVSSPGRRCWRRTPRASSLGSPRQPGPGSVSSTFSSRRSPPTRCGTTCPTTPGLSSSPCVPGSPGSHTTSTTRRSSGHRAVIGWRHVGAAALAKTAVPNLHVQVEVQEGMTAYEWGADTERRYRDRVKGPTPLVGLRLSDIDTSESFDWNLLRRVFAENVLDAHGHPIPAWPWQLTPANPRHPVDRAAWAAMVEAVGPKWLGTGFGMAVATKAYRECLFGARIQPAPSLTLGEIRDEPLRLEPLVLAMSASVNDSTG